MLEALYQRYYKELYIFVFSLCGSESVTDDILQDTFLKALLTLKDSHTNMRAWLYVVARNLYYNYYNKQKKQMTIEAAFRSGKPVKGTEKGSDPITVFWGLFTEGDCGDA